MSASAVSETTSSVFYELYDRIPQEMKDLPQWVGWRFEPNPKGGKDKKVPKNPRTGNNASSIDPKTWGTFEKAYEGLDKFGLDGISFILTEHDPFVMIDLDGCVNPNTGEIAPWTEQLVALFDSYTEVSPSGTGLHILVRGELLNGGKGRKCGPIEAYGHARACTMTGNLHSGITIEDHQEALDWLYQAMKPIADALAKYGDKFSLLFAGRWEAVKNTKDIPYPSQSEADLAFTKCLASVEATKEQIDAAMLLSGLHRKKWNEAGYREATIGKAMEGSKFHRDSGADSDAALLSYGAHDKGNAEAVISLYGHRFLYSDAWGWLTYTGTHWTQEGGESALTQAIAATLEQRHKVATEANNDAAKWASIPNAAKVGAAKALLQAYLTVQVSEFDKSPDHLNVANGVLDLRTGELEPHSPEQRFTYCLSVPYDADADASMWTAFLQEVIGGGPEVLDYVQMAVGYSLTGHTRAEKLFYLYGSGRNGNGTFTETLLTLLREPLAKEVDFSTFTRDRDHDAQNFDLAPLKPARFIAASESSKYERLNEAKIKQLTGGNDVYCAHKHKPHFSYRPQYKIWLSSNCDVNADPSDRAVWSRIVRIVFPHSFEDKADTTLKERLKRLENLAGVLAWAVEGAKRWYAPLGGLETPQGNVEELRAVRAELDHVQQWLDEATERRPDAWTPNQKLYGSYGEWCKANGNKPCALSWLMRILKEKEYKVGVKKRSGGPRGVQGLHIRPRL